MITQRDTSDITHAKLLFVYFSGTQAQICLTLIALRGLLKREVSFHISCSYYEHSKQPDVRRHLGGIKEDLLFA